MKVRKGDRVGAMESLEDNKLTLIGFGVYKGKSKKNMFNFRCPKILLDNGNIVWGYECWWDAEEEVKQLMKGMEIIVVDKEEENEI